MLIDRYVFRELLSPTLLGLLVYTSLFWVHRFFLLARKLTEGVFSFEDVLLALLYITPSILAQTLPMSTLLGVLIGFARLSADSEITALRASGVSYFRLLVPTLLLAGLAWAGSAGVYLKAVPWANERFVDLHAEAAQRADLNREIEPGRWLHEAGAHIHARGVDLSDPAQPWLLDVDVVLGKKGESRREHVRAERARITRVIGDEGTARLELVLLGMTDVMWDTAERKAFRSASERYVRPLEDAQLPGLRPKRRRVFKGSREKSLGELHQTLDHLAEMDRIDALAGEQPKVAAEQKAELSRDARWVLPQRRERARNETVLEIHKKFSIPLACVVFAITGMPLGIATRRGGRPASFVISLGVIALWYFIYAPAAAWVDVGRLSPVVAAWLPDIVIAIVGVYLLVRTRRQQAVGLHRAAETGLLLAALVLLFLTGVLAVEKLLGGAAGPRPGVPAWLPVAGASALGLHALLRLFRQPVAAALARVAEAFRRGRRSEPGPAESGTSLVGGAASAAPSVAPRRRALLEQLRSGLVFGLLALAVVCVLQVFQHEDGLGAGLSSVVFSWEGPALALGLLAAALLQRAGVPVLRTVDAWVLAAYARAFTLVLGSMIALFCIGQYVDMADEILQNAVGWDVVGEFYLHLLPRMLFETTPYAAMIAALVVFGVMTKYNETTALRCLGISVFRIVTPVLLLGLLASALTFLLHDYVLPAANRRAEELRDVIQGRPARPRFETRGLTFARDNRTLYLYDRLLLPSRAAGSVRSPHFLNLTAVEIGPDGRASRLFSAKDAVWDGSTWVLRAGWQAVFASDEQVALEPFQELALARLEEPDYFASSRVEPGEMTFGEYRGYIEDQALAGYATSALEMHLQKKLAFPSASLVLVLVGLPFAFRSGRRGALYGVGVALILAVSYYAVQALFAALGDNGQLPPMLAAWAPNALFGVAGIHLLLGVRT